MARDFDWQVAECNLQPLHSTRYTNDDGNGITPSGVRILRSQLICATKPFGRLTNRLLSLAFLQKMHYILSAQE